MSWPLFLLGGAGGQRADQPPPPRPRRCPRVAHEVAKLEEIGRWGMKPVTRRFWLSPARLRRVEPFLGADAREFDSPHFRSLLSLLEKRRQRVPAERGNTLVVRTWLHQGHAEKRVGLCRGQSTDQTSSLLVPNNQDITLIPTCGRCQAAATGARKVSCVTVRKLLLARHVGASLP
jgi:hypothetical protein